MFEKLDLIIRNGTVVFPDEIKKADIGISSGKIVEIREEIPKDAAEVVDASGKHVFPAATDGHVHFDDPGRTEWETIKNGSRALAAGGGAVFFDMPLNSSPCTLDKENFDKKLAVAKRDSVCDFGIWGGLCPKNLDKLEELAKCGVVGFKAFSCFSGIDEFPGIDDYTAYRGMKKLKELNLPLKVHCENDDITGTVTKLKNEQNKTGLQDYLEAHAPITEIESISRIITFAEETGCKLIIAHVSTAKGVELVTEAKKRGVDVSCETIGHYLILTEEDVERLGTLGKCSPPIRDAKNQLRMWGKLFNDEIAYISSDHSPCDPKLKEKEFMKAWGGISGCQSTLPAILTYGYHDRMLPLTKAAALTASNVNEIFRIEGKGKIGKGYDADLAIVDLDKEYVLRAEDLFYLHKVSPYVGSRFKGEVTQTILRGKTIFQDGRITASSGGRLIVPKNSDCHR